MSMILIICDLKGECSGPGDKAELQRERPAVQAHRRHHQPASLKGFLRNSDEIGPICFRACEGPALLALPATHLELQKFFKPGVGISVGAEFIKFDASCFRKASLLPPHVLPVSGRDPRM